MNGLAGELGEKNISLNPDAIIVRQIPYILNPIYKEKVKEKIDKMVQAGVIELVEESKWINHVNTESHPHIVRGYAQYPSKFLVDVGFI